MKQEDLVFLLLELVEEQQLEGQLQELLEQIQWGFQRIG